MKKIVLYVLITFASFGSLAGNVKGTVRDLYIHSTSDKVMFNINATSYNFTNCATSSRYAFKVGSPQGQAMLSALLFAKAAGKSINIHGGNSCDIHGDSEDIAYLWVNE